jgi:hypothetical protein
MVHSRDEAAVVLKAHLILEEFLNIWTSKVTGTEDLFAGCFVPFKTKLSISKNLGLPNDFFVALNKFNDIRNKYSHRRQFNADLQAINSISMKVDSISSDVKLNKCDQFHIELSGLDASGTRRDQ